MPQSPWLSILSTLSLILLTTACSSGSDGELTTVSREAMPAAASQPSASLPPTPRPTSTPIATPTPTPSLRPTPQPQPSPSPQPPAPPSPIPSPTDEGTAPQATAVITMTNLQRATIGLDPLLLSPELTAAAQAHAEDMAARGYFSHAGLDGSTPATRATAAGYAWIALGENIAQGQSAPEQVMQSWMASEGHRSNILNPVFGDIGVGYAISPRTGNPYWVQLFGRGAITP